MANPLYESLMQSGNIQNGSVFDQFGGKQGFQQKLSSFAEVFRHNANCTPEQMVRQLVSSGQMTQTQFDQFSQIANMITGKQ